jgi:preprotein translocase subunit SecB
MTVINYELSQIRLAKSVFFPNPEYRPPQTQAIPLNLRFDNRGAFNDRCDVVDFVQGFQTTGGVALPFTLEVELVAVFNLSAPVPPSEHDRFIHRFLPQAVFPFTREYIADITRRGGFPPLILNPAFGGLEAGPSAPPPGHQVN